MISFTCQCGKPYRFSPKFRGQKLRCSDCGASLVVPEESQVEEVPVEKVPEAPEAQPAKPAPAPVEQPQSQSQSQPQPPAAESNEVFLQASASSFGGSIIELTNDPMPASPMASATPSAAVEQEYYMVSSEAPMFLKDFAITEPEEAGPPSEALSVILSREAVAQHLLNMEDTLGLRPTPVPLPPQRKQRRTRSEGTFEPYDESAPNHAPKREPQQPVMGHAMEKASNPVIYILLGVIALLLICILVILLIASGKSGDSSAVNQTKNQSAKIASSLWNFHT